MELTVTKELRLESGRLRVHLRQLAFLLEEPRRSRGVAINATMMISSLYKPKDHHNHMKKITRCRHHVTMNISSLKPLWSFILRPLLSFLAHKRISKIIFIILPSFRAKTVYKVVTVVQPPFMMWNATTGAP